MTHHPDNDKELERLKRIEWAAQVVHDRFKLDLNRGYNTRDKTFGVDVLGFSLRKEPPAVDEAPHDIELLVCDADGQWHIVRWFDDGFTPARFRDDEGRNVVFEAWWPLPQTRRS